MAAFMDAASLFFGICGNGTILGKALAETRSMRKNPSNRNIYRCCIITLRDGRVALVAFLRYILQGARINGQGYGCGIATSTA